MLVFALYVLALLVLNILSMTYKPLREHRDGLFGYLIMVCAQLMIAVIAAIIVGWGIFAPGVVISFLVTFLYPAVGTGVFLYSLYFIKEEPPMFIPIEKK